MVEFVGVTRAYGPRLALDDVNLALEPGELAFLVGPSGAGKTTLLKLINLEIRPTNAEASVDSIPAHLVKAYRARGSASVQGPPIRDQAAGRTGRLTRLASS